VDTAYPGTGITVLQETVISSPWETENISGGTFVVGIAGKSTTYYLFTKAALDVFFDYLFSDVYVANLVGSTWEADFPDLKSRTNPLQYITQIMWLPLSVVTSTLVESIRVGWVDVPTSAWAIVGTGLFSSTHDFTVLRHPQAQRGTYLNNAPYSNYLLFYPPWGTIPLDPDGMANSDTVTVYWSVDARTGVGTLAIIGGVQHLMSITHAQVGVHQQVS
jgi:hypothetical protein